jgi:hypothetical protein
MISEIVLVACLFVYVSSAYFGGNPCCPNSEEEEISDKIIHEKQD